jgi:hypothetical protein
MIKLKVSEKEKYAKEGEWFKEYLNSTVPQLLPDTEDYQAMLIAYKVVNNDLSGFKELLKKFCNPLADDIGVVDEDIQPYPELHNSINVLKGEIVQRRDQLHLMLLSANAIKAKNQKMFEAIKQSVDEKLGIELQKMEMQMQGMDEKQVNEFIQGLRTQLEPEDLAQKNWLSEVEIFYNKALEYCTYDQNVLDKRVDTMADLATADRFFIYSGWTHGKPTLEIRNPLYVRWHKSPNEKMVHKSDWIVYQKPITLTNAIEAYELTDEEIEELNMSYGKGLDNRHALGNTNEFVFDHTRQDLLLAAAGHNVDMEVGLSQSTFLNNNNTLLWETHFEFKAFKELIFLSYKDDYGENITSVLGSDFEIPKSAKKEKFINRYDMEADRYVWTDFGTEFKAERIWLPRKYEIIRLGSNVYPKSHIREVPYQVTNIERPFEAFTLSTFGVNANARNAKSVSLVQRAIPPYLQLLYVKHVMNNELSKYQGAIQAIDVDQIPDSLGQDLEGNPIRDKVAAYLATLRKTNKDLYSGSQVSYGALPPSTRSPGSSGYLIGTAVELMNLNQLAELIKQEISLAMGISPQRLASFQQGSNVSDNQQSIQQSYAITEPYFFIHSLIWKDALNDWLSNFRTYCETQMRVRDISEMSFQYWLPGNIEQVLQVTPDSIEHTDIGLFLSSSSSFERYAEIMLQNAQAFAQNQGQGITAVSQIIKDIVSKSSPEEIHKRIQMEEAKIQERQMQLQQQQTEGQKQLMDIQEQAAVKAHEREKELIVLKEEERRITEIEKIGIQATMLGKQQDLNQNNVPDSVDLANIYLKEKGMNLKEKEFAHKTEIDKEKLALEEKKIKASRAKANQK